MNRKTKLTVQSQRLQWQTKGENKTSESPADIEEEVEEAEAVEGPKEDIEEKREEGKKPEKKEEKGVFSYYKIEGESLIRQRPFCERCGPGTFMADHGNRYTCGHCGFTRYKQKED